MPVIGLQRPKIRCNQLAIHWQRMG